MMQRFISTQTINPNEKSVFMGNIEKFPVEYVGTYRLILNTGFYLDFLDTCYVPSISRNLVSLSKLDVVGYSCTKRDLVNECSTYLWHKRLGHISKKMMKRLV